MHALRHLLICVLLVLPTLLQAQIGWTRSQNNPVFNRSSGSPNDPNALQWSFGPSVFFDGSRNAYFSWFETFTSAGTKIAFSHATSFEGSRWYYYSKSPILEVTPNSFDALEIRGPHVIKDAGGYKLYYLGRSNGGYSIGLATSADGISWQKYQNNPVLLPGASGAWDDGGILFCNVLLVGPTYYMWYTGNDGTTSRIGLATSPDGITWTKHASNPLINIGGAGQWDAVYAEAPQVTQANGLFYMLYTGRPNIATQQIGLATSTDGISWQKYANNPVLIAQDGWEGANLSATSLIFRNGKFHLWYTGNGAGLQAGYATANLEYPPPQSNMVANGSFETGTSPWTFYTDGSGTFNIISPGTHGSNAARVSISTPGTNVQLSQIGIALNPNTLYRLSFDAYSNTGHDLSVFLHKNNSPYTNYGVNSFVCDLSAGWQHFTLVFTSTGFVTPTNDARLRFWFAPYDAAGDRFYVDNIVLNTATAQEARESGIENLSAAEIPKTVYLSQNYPNPFNPETVISFGLPRSEHVSVKVFDTLGREVASLVDEVRGAGNFRVSWDATTMPTGVYFCRLQTERYSEILKMMLVK